MVANDLEANGNEIERLLNKAVKDLYRQFEGGVVFANVNSQQFETVVFETLSQLATGTSFEGKVEIRGGQKFPDIVVKMPGENSYYGIEVKTTKKESGWKTTGNSVLESSRVDNVEVIYLFFGRMTKKAEFKWRQYEDCLYRVAVTHSPRYLIDMELARGQTIFDRMETDYNQVRTSENPIQPIVEYHRRHLKPGQDLWWVDSQDDDAETDLILRSWNSLTLNERNNLIGKGMVLFPEVFGPSSQTKYMRYGTWLFSRHGVVDASIRDRFTSGGTVTLSVRGKDYPGTPKAIGNLKKRLKLIIDSIPTIQTQDYVYYWGQRPGNNRFSKWIDKVIEVAKDTVPFDLRRMILEEEERLKLAHAKKR